MGAEGQTAQIVWPDAGTAGLGWVRIDTPMSTQHVRSDPGIDHLAFHAASEADVDAVFESLTEHGYPVDEPPRAYDYSPGYYAIGFDDPDGIRLEVVFDPTTNP